MAEYTGPVTSNNEYTGPIVDKEGGIHEFFEEGMLGRIGKGAGEYVASLGQGEQKNKYMKENFADTTPKDTRSVSEILSQTASEITHHPGAFTVNLLKSLVQDPEFLLGGELGAVGKAAELTAKMSKASQIAAKVVTHGVESGAIMAGAETLAQSVEGKGYNASQIMAQGAMGGVAGMALGGAKEMLGKGKGPTPPEKTNLGDPSKPGGLSIEEQTRKEQEFIQEIEQKVNRENHLKAQELDQAAFRNPEDGSIHPQGSGHSEALKEKYPDWEEGFLTKSGEFVDRHEAATIATENHSQHLKTPIDPKEGLHSSNFGAERMNALKHPAGPEFKDRVAPTWEEMHNVLADAKTVGEGLQRVIDNELGGKGQQLLAKLLLKNTWIKEAGLRLNADKVPDDVVEGQIIAGQYHAEDHHVDLNHSGNLQTFLHEAVHAGTLHALNDKTSKASFELNKIYDLVKEKVTPEELKEYGFTNVHEMVAEAFTNPKFQEVLSRYKTKDNATTIWTQLKNIIKDALGVVDKETRTALDAVLDRGAKIIEEGTPPGLRGEETAKSIVKPELAIKDYHESNDTSAIDNKIVDYWGKNLTIKEADKLGLVGRDKRYRVYQDGNGKWQIADRPQNDPEYHSQKRIDERDAVWQQLIHKASGGTVHSIVKPELAGAPTPDDARLDPSKIKSEEDFKAKAKELMATKGKEAVRDFYRQWEAQKKGYRDHVKEAEEYIHGNLKNKEADRRIVEINSKEMEKILPDQMRREAAIEAYDRGDYAKLTGEEKAVVDKYVELNKDIGQRGKETGVIKNLAENYVTYIVDKVKNPKGAVEGFLNDLFGVEYSDGRMSPESRFGKEHRYETFEALQKAIKDRGLVLRTKDPAQIYKDYATSMERAIENKKLMDNLKLVRDLTGEKMYREVSKDDPIKYDEKPIPSRQFAGWVVKEELLPATKFAFEAKDMNEFYKAVHGISQAVKLTNVAGSLFHAKTLLEVLSSARIPLITPIKEIGLATVDKTLGTKLSGLTRAVDMYRKGGMGDTVDQWMREGLVLGGGIEDVQRGALTTIGKLGDALINKFAPETHAMEKFLSKTEKATLEPLNKFTWDFLHTGIKLSVAEKYLERQRIEAKDSGKPLDEKKARQEIAKFINTAAGGLDWFALAKDSTTEMGKRMAMSAYSPEGRRALQVALFAPDWTVSTIKAFTTALPKEMNPANWHPIEGIKGMRRPTTKEDYARLYQFKTALTYFTVLNGINMMTANRPIWENKDQTRIEFPDGTSIQGMKHALEPYHWMTSPIKTLGNKLGFVPRAAVVGITGLEYASPDAQKLVDPSALGRASQIGKMLAPFQLQAFMQAPPGEGLKRAALGTLGFPELGSTPEQKLESRRARTKALREAARKYHEEAKRKGWE